MPFKDNVHIIMDNGLLIYSGNFCIKWVNLAILYGEKIISFWLNLNQSSISQLACPGKTFAIQTALYQFVIRKKMLYISNTN